MRKCRLFGDGGGGVSRPPSWSASQDGAQDGGGVADATLGLDPDEGIYWYGPEGEVLRSAFMIDEAGVIVEGDISLGSVEEASSVHEEIAATLAAGGETDKAAMRTFRRRRWKDGVIRFHFSGPFDESRRFGSGPTTGGEPIVGEKNLVREAAAIWNSYADITGIEWREVSYLKPRKSGVRFDRNGASGQCTSKVGRHARRQDIELYDDCFNLATLVHEMGHAMGLFHEHQRAGRNNWIALFPHNHVGKRANTWELDLPWLIQARGSYDTDSIMHYRSFGERPSLGLYSPPKFLDRQVLSLYRPLAARPNTLVPDLRWNPMVRLGGRGVDLDTMRVADVDGDGLDDLLAQRDGALVWSSQARSGWRALLPGGQPVTARVGEVAVGRFDAHEGKDVVRVAGHQWTLYSSAGTTRSVSRPTELRDFEVADLDGDGLDELFVITEDGRFSVAEGGDLLGALTPRTSADMGVDDVTLAPLAGAAAGPHVVASRDGALLHLAPGSSRFEPVFPGGGYGPLPEHAHALETLSFIHVDASGADPTEPVDIVTYSDGRDGSLALSRALVFVADPLGSSAVAMSPFRIAGIGGVDAKEELLAGYFDDPARGALLTLGFIWDRGLFGARPARSDLTVLGIYHQSAGPARLAERYPLTPSSTPDANLALQERFIADVAVDERVELSAMFVSPSGMQEVLVETRRIGRNDASEEIGLRSATGRGDILIVDEAFQHATPGVYEVRMTPTAPAPESAWDTPVWQFRVGGATGLCGDGILDPGESCDDGNIDETDACTNECYIKIGAG